MQLNYAEFKDEILSRIPRMMRKRNAEHIDEVFDELVAAFDANRVETAAERVQQRVGMPWALIITILIELLKYWLLSNLEERRVFRSFQTELLS